MKWIRPIVDSFIHLIYPPLCLYCRTTLHQKEETFCRNCSDLLEFIDPTVRCRYCFGETNVQKQPLICFQCTREPTGLQGIAAAFDYLGPAACLVKRMKYGNQPQLALGAAASMVAQFARLNWPMPDIIIPAPMPLVRQLSRGYNQSQLLAEAIGRYLQRPIVNALYRKSGDYSQAGLSLAQRRTLERSTFQLRPHMDFVDQHLLLIDDVTTSGTTLKRCAEALQEGCPTSVYALTLCRAT